jgi:hypothetical protein
MKKLINPLGEILGGFLLHSGKVMCKLQPNQLPRRSNMAIVPQQEMFVIRDTVLNKIMEGAKGQLAFGTTGHARKSLVHTGWWTEYKRYDTVRKLMPSGNRIVDEYEHLGRMVQQDSKVNDWKNRDQQLHIARNLIQNDIYKWCRGSKEYAEAHRKIKFDKQTRYAVECLTSIETKEIK